MRLFRQVVFDETIYDNIDAYTSDDLADLLTMADQLTLQAVVDNVHHSGGLGPSLFVSLETSNDGQNWFAQATPISEANFAADVATSIFGFVTGTAPLLCKARLRVRAQSFDSAHVRITMSARGRRALPARGGRGRSREPGVGSESANDDRDGPVGGCAGKAGSRAAARHDRGSRSTKSFKRAPLSSQGQQSDGACNCSSRSAEPPRLGPAPAARRTAGNRAALAPVREGIPITNCNIFSDLWQQAKCHCDRACSVLDDGTSFGGPALQACFSCCSAKLDEQEQAGKPFNGFAAAISCGVPPPPPLRNPPQAAPSQTPTVVDYSPIASPCAVGHTPCVQSCFTLYADNNEYGQLAACISCCDKSLLLCDTPGFSGSAAYSNCEYEGCTGGVDGLHEALLLSCATLPAGAQAACIAKAAGVHSTGVAHCQDIFDGPTGGPCEGESLSKVIFCSIACLKSFNWNGCMEQCCKGNNLQPGRVRWW